MDTKNISGITAKTIQMQPPILLADHTTKRQFAIKDESAEKLISQEAFLRRTAYKNTTIKTNESFFDDTDMVSEYYLVVVYDRNSTTPLLSSRYYFDKSVISKYLKGDNNSENELSYLGEKLILTVIKKELFF